MATYSKVFLSGQGDGTGQKVFATSTPGELIHTAHATAKDEIHLWAWNSDATDLLLTVEWGGVTDPDNLVEFTVPTQDGWYLIVPGFILSDSGEVRAFAPGGKANLLVINGFVNRIT